eukprot:COSAG05_NODE_687_length_7922_cov_7.188035_3_plen_207_part_00
MPVGAEQGLLGSDAAAEYFDVSELQSMLLPDTSLTNHPDFGKAAAAPPFVPEVEPLNTSVTANQSSGTWRRYLDAEGDAYFVNTQTGESTWCQPAGNDASEQGLPMSPGVSSIARGPTSSASVHTSASFSSTDHSELARQPPQQEYREGRAGQSRSFLHLAAEQAVHYRNTQLEKERGYAEQLEAERAAAKEAIGVAEMTGAWHPL